MVRRENWGVDSISRTRGWLGSSGMKYKSRRDLRTELSRTPIVNGGKEAEKSVIKRSRSNPKGEKQTNKKM